MPKAQSQAARCIPEEMLRKATYATTARARAKYATRGLAQPAVDVDTRAMLLRQLYLSQMEGRRFAQAQVTALEMVALAVMPDVARQDAARACLGTGELDKALEHLRIATRVSPASRRAFHLWTLGSTLYLLGRHREAVGALSRAARWGTTDKPLYRGQLALARRAAGEGHEDLGELRRELSEAPCGQGYGLFVLAELAAAQQDREAALSYASAFVERTTGGRVALEVALQAELRRAREILRELGVEDSSVEIEEAEAAEPDGSSS